MFLRFVDWWETYNEWPGLGNPATASDYFYRPQRTSVNSSVETYVTGGQTFVAEDEYTTSRQEFLGTNVCPNDPVNIPHIGAFHHVEADNPGWPVGCCCKMTKKMFAHKTWTAAKNEFLWGAPAHRLHKCANNTNTQKT